MKKERKNYWKVSFVILAILNVITFAYIIFIIFFHHDSGGRLYCQSSVNCTECSGGMQTCHYYDDEMKESTDTIKCECGD